MYHIYVDGHAYVVENEHELQLYFGELRDQGYTLCNILVVDQEFYITMMRSEVVA